MSKNNKFSFECPYCSTYFSQNNFKLRKNKKIVYHSHSMDKIEATKYKTYTENKCSHCPSDELKYKNYDIVLDGHNDQ